VTRSSIPIGDAPALRRAGLRSRGIRLALAAGLVVSAVLSFFVARSTDLAPTPLLPPGSSGIIVLDVSGSVEGSTLDRAYAGLSQLAASDDRFGMVVFASRAYEALPPNTPARELKPVAQFYHPLNRASIAPGRASLVTPVSAFYPANPWQVGFDTGTEISQGLQLAKSVILANNMTRRSVWLISDLADDPHDFANVARVATEYINFGITLNVIALNPTKSDARFFERFLGPSGTLVRAKPSTEVRIKSEYGFPIGIAAVAMVIALLLAANELWSSPIEWHATRPFQSVSE